jgi:hypothetical protein
MSSKCIKYTISIYKTIPRIYKALGSAWVTGSPATERGRHPLKTYWNLMFQGGECLSLGHLLRTWPPDLPTVFPQKWDYVLFNISIIMYGHNLHIVISKRSVFLNIDCSDELYVHYSPRVFLNADCLDITVCTLLASRVSQHWLIWYNCMHITRLACFSTLTALI